MLSAGPPGFVHAPVTKAVIGLVVLATVFGSILDSHTRLTLRVSDVIHNFQVWRLITHNFVFTTPGELLFGTVLLYYFRLFERQMGSSRYAAYAIITTTLSTMFLCLCQLFFQSLIPASGPYALIFASLIHFYFETPKIYHFQILGSVRLSDKSFAYLLALQLLCSSPPRSLLSGLTAVVSGILYRLPFVKDRDLPESLTAVCSTYVLPLLGTSPRASRTRSRRQRHSLHPATQSFSEPNVDTLVSMGFSREQSIAALVRTRDDVHRATEQLLLGSG